jgi:eukaryotic-like serine/threonine-protein kinase
MNIERLHQIEEIYHAVLEAPPSEREEIFNRKCGNDEDLRCEVESLLSFENTNESFLDSLPESLVGEIFAKQDEGMRLDDKEIGHYKVRHLLGKGGMGEVYLAEDTKLRRQVALKVLPPEFSANRERKRRFETEARAVSALNHPNIITIYEIEEAENVNFIATEFIDGQTLRERLAEKPFSWQETVKIGIQIAEALDSAHVVGIIHRDINPRNIMIRRDGIVKVLDFGLAKMQSEEWGVRSEESEVAVAELESDSQLLTPHSLLLTSQTRAGTIMGTLNYMSPEQALGEKIDARTDIFSFGVVLYEMLTGISPFAGASDGAVYNATINKKLSSVCDFNDEIPPALDVIVKRALEKNREARYQTMQELVADLRNYTQEGRFQNKTARPTSLNRPEVQTKFNNPATGDLFPVSATAENPVVEIKRSGRSIALIFATLAIVFGGLGFAGYEFLGKTEKKLGALNVEKLTTNGKTSDATISPDGKYVVYVVNEGGKSSLWTRQIATMSNLQIIAPTDARYYGLGFSPDGNYVNFAKRDNDGEIPVLYQMPVLGGEQKKLISDIYGAADYSPDGKQLAFVRGRFPNPDENSLIVADADGTNEKIIASLKNPESFRTEGGYPVWSPDGKTIACIVRNTAVNGWNLVEVQVADGTIRPTANQAWESIRRIAWAKDDGGLLILGADKPTTYYRQLWRTSGLDVEAEKITTDFYDYLGMSVTKDSETIATVQANQISSIWVAPDGDANRAVMIKSGGTLDGTSGLEWTPDNRIVFSSQFGKTTNIWIMNADGSNQKQLTFTDGKSFNPKVTDDGRYIIYNSQRDEKMTLWRMGLDGGNPQQLTSGTNINYTTLSPDSRWIIYSTLDAENLWKISIDGGTPVQLTDYLSVNPRISPDGKWIACEYQDENKRVRRTAIIPFAGGKPTKIFDLPGGTNNFQWSQDSRSLIYSVTDDGMTFTRGKVGNLWSFPLNDNSAPKQLTNFKTEDIYKFDWSADGKQLVLARGTTVSDVVLITNFR